MKADRLNLTLFWMQLSGQLARLTSLVLSEISKFSIDGSFVESKICNYFVAVDEIQVLSRPEWIDRYCKNRSNGNIMSFARFFTWTNELLKTLRTVTSGTGICITSLDSIISSAIKSEREIPVDIITNFDILSPTDVRQNLEKVCVSAGAYFPQLKAIETPSQQILWKLQGRSRILMRYIQKLVESDGSQTLDELFDEYEKSQVFPSNHTRRAFDSFGDLWLRFLSADNKTISFSLTKNAHLKDTPCNLALKVLTQSVQIRREDETAEFTCASFLVNDYEIDTIQVGLFPLRSYSQEQCRSEFFLAEPMILSAGLVVVSSRQEWINICTVNALQRVVDHVATPQIAGSYFDLFIAMKFAWDKCFRMKVLELAKSAVAETEADANKSWLNDVKVPEGILPICLNADDSSVLNMFSTCIADKVLMPSVFAGPDVMMGIFLVGNKFSSSHEKISQSESKKNGETTDPRLLYAFRGRKRLNGMDEIEDEKSIDKNCGMRQKNVF
jgi:hypothetical protein